MLLLSKLPISKVESFLKSNFIEIHRNALELKKKCQKNGVGKGLGQVRIKNLLAQTIPDKIFGTKWSNPVKLDRRRKVWYLFLRVF